MAATITTFAYDAVAGSPQYTSANTIDWMNQVAGRPIGVIPGEDLGLACTSDGLGNILTQNGVCVLGGRIAMLTGGPASTAIPSLPASGFQTAYAVVMRYSPSTQSTSIIIIAGSTIANPGPAVNPSIVSATDILLCYVKVVNTAGTNAYTVTEGRTFSNISVLPITGAVTYTASQLAAQSQVFAALTGTAVVDVSAGSIYRGAELFIKNTSAAAQTLTLRLIGGGTGSGHDLTLLQNEWAFLIWDGSIWIIASTNITTGRITLLTSGTSFTVPAGVTRIEVTTIGGGGGGGNGGTGGTGGGGGGGGGGSGAFQKSVVTCIPGATITYAIGGGGSAANAGGNTTFTGATTAIGGGAGSTGSSGGGAPGAGGTGGGGNMGLGGSGSAGGGGGTNGSPGGLGGGAGGAGGSTNGGTTGFTGGTGVGYGGGGGGGGGAGTGGAGGAGAAGAVIVIW